MNKVVYIWLLTCFLVSCGKSEIRTDFIITPYVQLQENVVRELTPHVKAYAYYGDTTYWKVMSWEDASNGILTSKSDETQTKSPDFTAEPDSRGRLVLGPVTQLKLMLLVCQTDPDAVGGVKMYAWRNAATLDDLPQVSVNLTFKPWRQDARKSEGRWLYVSEHPPVEPGPEPPANSGI